MRYLTTKTQGDTFVLIVGLADENGIIMTGAELSLTADIKDGTGTLIDSFVITETEIEGEYLVKAEDTSKFPVGIYLYTRIVYEFDDDIASSEKIRMLFERV